MFIHSKQYLQESKRNIYIGLSIKYPHTVDKEFLSMHVCHNLYFQFHVHDHMHFIEPHMQVVHPWSNLQ